MNNLDYTIQNGIGISIEWLEGFDLGLIRGGRGFRHGDRYEFTAVALNDGKAVEIKMFLGFYNRDVRRALNELFKGLGIHEVRFERLNQGSSRPKKISVR